MTCPYCMKQTTHDPNTGNFTCDEHGVVAHDLIYREPICNHIWVLDSSSTCGNTFRCIKCTAVKTDPVYDPNYFWHENSYSTYMLGC